MKTEVKEDQMKHFKVHQACHTDVIKSLEPC